MQTRPTSALRSVPSKRDVALALRDVRDRTLALIEPLSPDALMRQHDPLMSPIAWDLGHIGAFEELWLVLRPGAVTSESELEEVYDAFRTPRAARGDLALPALERTLARMSDVRAAALEVLADADFRSENPLLRGAFAWEMVRQHEAQHQETILQTIQLIDSEPYVPIRRREPPSEPAGASPGEMVRVPSGPFAMGAAGAGFAYDNERPRHLVRVPTFEIGRHPVTNGEYVEFLAAGGYTDSTLWSEEGWAWARQSRLSAPKYWESADAPGAIDADAARELSRDQGISGWRRRTSLGASELDPLAPVVHVCWHEAEAYARFAAARLPTEVEWEKAASWDPDTTEPRRWPWGEDPPAPPRANLDQLRFDVDPIGSHPLGRSAAGCEGLIGDVWEWTSSAFRGYEGFRAFPYPEYSEVFFDDGYRVLRGGSWATRPAVARNSFRNWDYPIRRQIFSGFRVARDG